MDQPFKVRDKSRARVRKAILALPFKKNNSGNYNYADAQIFNKQVDCELQCQYNESTTDGMKGLTSNDHDNKVSCATIQSHHHVAGWHQGIKGSSRSQKKYEQTKMTTTSPTSTYQSTSMKMLTAKIQHDWWPSVPRKVPLTPSARK